MMKYKISLYIPFLPIHLIINLITLHVYIYVCVKALSGFEVIFGTDGRECVVCIDGLGQTAFILEDLLLAEAYFERLLKW